MFCDLYLATGSDENNPRYIGCYQDDKDRDLDYNVGRGYDPRNCNIACQKYKYFALQYDGSCWCGDAYGTGENYKWRPDDECGGAAGQGKPWRNSVFETFPLSGETQCSIKNEIFPYRMILTIILNEISEKK